MKNPLVSVIMPVFNGEKYIRESIESVLSQDYSPIELIVINDGSTDGTSQILASLGMYFTYLVQENKGTAATRNRGVDKSKGEFIAFIDQDDIWKKGKISLQYDLLSNDKHLDMVLSHLEFIYTYGKERIRQTSPGSTSQYIPGYTPSAMLIRKKSYFKVGYFDQGWLIGEWVDWYLRSLDMGLKILMVPDVLVKKRIHNSNKGYIYINNNKEYVYILKSHLDRKRNKIN